MADSAAGQVGARTGHRLMLTRGPNRLIGRVSATDTSPRTKGEPMSDYLAHFAAWDGEPLGPNEDLPPGYYGSTEAPVTMLHYAGAWGMSTARQDRNGTRIPAVYLRTIAGVLGTGPAYHVLDGVVDADVAEEWGQTLILAARRAREDAEANR